MSCQAFDHALCVRQLRYAGLMETAKIRQAGYPIRYSYGEFVHRYRLVVPGIPPAEKTDCKAAAKRICSEVLQDQDYRFGYTKVFLKDHHDVTLEELRHTVLIRSVVRTQANIRRFLLRRKYLRMRAAAITIQKHFRARGYRTHYLVLRRGYLRLQAVIKSRELRRTFINLRKFFRNLQAYCRGYLVRRLVTEKGEVIRNELAQFRQERDETLKSYSNTEEAERDYEKKFNDLMRSIWVTKEAVVENNHQNADAIDDRYVDDVFGFLKDTATPAGTVRGTGFGVVNINYNNSLVSQFIISCKYF